MHQCPFDVSALPDKGRQRLSVSSYKDLLACACAKPRHASAGATSVTSPLMTLHWKAKQGINWSNGGVGIVKVVIGPQLTLSCGYW